MINLEQVMEQINKTRGRFTSATNRIPQVQDRIFDLTKQWRDLVIDGASDEELHEVHEKLLQAEKELELLEGLDAEREIRQTLAKDKKLADMAQSFIAQEEETLESMLTEEEKLADTVTDAYDNLIEAVRELNTQRTKMVEASGQIQDVKRALDMPIPSAGIYMDYKMRMTDVPHDKLFNKILIAAGLQPKY